MELSGNTILVTGGGSGIGRVLAEALNDLGNTVIVAGRREDALRDVARSRPGIDTAVLDVSDPASIRAATASVVQRHPGLNVLINNAGTSYALSQRFSLRGTSVRVQEVLPPWVNTGPADAKSFEGAVHVDDFVRDALAQLGEGRDEVVVDAAVASRRSAGPDEQEFVTELNTALLAAFPA